MCGEGVSYGCQFHLGKGDGCGCCLRLSYKEWGDSEKPFTDAGMCRRVAYYGGTPEENRRTLQLIKGYGK